MKKRIAILAGDGIGPEVIREAQKVLLKISELFGHTFEFQEGLIGAIAIEITGDPFPPETKKLCFESDAILFGAVGDPKYDLDPKLKPKPEDGLLEMRKSLNLYANIRPVFSFPPLFRFSPLKDDRLKDVDIIFVRELTGGIYFGRPKGIFEDRNQAIDTCVYSKQEILRVTKVAVELAKKRKKKLTLVDKANVLATSRLWRETVMEYLKGEKEVEFNMLYVDNAAMQLIQNPAQFDVILTENMFGDILTDEAAVIAGSIGLLPSASIGEKTSLYEPIHGSYYQAKGKNIANPVGTILSAAMMLEYSFSMIEEAHIIKSAIKRVIENGLGTKDIAVDNPLKTSEMGDEIVNEIEKIFMEDSKRLHSPQS